MTNNQSKEMRDGVLVYSATGQPVFNPPSWHPPQTVHAQLLAIGLPIVQYYVRDLTFHDANAVANIAEGDIAFWAPRECGTQFVHCPRHDLTQLQWNLGWLIASEKTFPGIAWHKIENGKVTPCTIHDARDAFRVRMQARLATGERAQPVRLFS